MPQNSTQTHHVDSPTQIIPVADRNIDGEGVKTVNARDLHAFLEVGKDFSTWIRNRITRYGFTEGRDFVVIGGVPPNGGTSTRGALIEYALTLDMAKELSMMERNDKGKQARRYFIACEKRANATASTPAMRAVAGMDARLGRLEADVRGLTLVASTHGSAPADPGSMSIRDAAKMLGTGEKRLFIFLRRERILTSDGSNLPYQRFLDAGYFKVSRRTWIHSDTAEATGYTVTLVTGKGLAWLRNRLADHPDAGTDCLIGSQYAAAVADVRCKRNAATNDRAFDGYAQAELELMRVERRHFQTCPACQAFEAIRMMAATAAGVR